MTHSRWLGLTLVICLGFVHLAQADVRTDEKTKFQLGGVLGKVAGIFGGKAVREGVDSTVMVKGDRMVMTNGSSSQIIDLAEEKVYTIDLKQKTYTVATFAEIRHQYEEARRKAEEEAKKSGNEKPEAAPQKQQNEPQVEVDFDIKNTGMTKTINGFETHQAVMTVTVREKGKTLDQSGGLVLTSDLWLAPRMPEMNELADFNLRYAQKLYGPMVTGASPQDMATVLAMYPMVKPAIEKMATEGKKLEGTPILTVITADAVKSAAQLAEEQKADQANSPANAKSVSGLLGGLARKAATKNEAPSSKATILTTSTEVLRISTSVSASDVALPAGLKQRNP